MTTYYCLRYVEGTPLSKRKHAPTIGRFDTFAAADDARITRFNADLLEVVRHTDPAPPVAVRRVTR